MQALRCSVSRWGNRFRRRVRFLGLLYSQLSEFYGGFSNWVEQIVESNSADDYRRRVSSPESASMWQSLSFGANYKAAYCMAVCPAGDEVIAPFLTDRSEDLKEVVRPLQDR